jgi:hypothetical protein
MGYSCSARANCVLDQVEKLDEFDRYSSNYKYILQIGKENKDGAITGTVYEFTGPWSQDKKDLLQTRPCKKTGSFRINPNGSIARLPGVSKRLYGVLEIAGIEAFDRQHYRGWNYVHS